MNITFIGKRKAAAISGVLLTLSIFSLATKGLDQGIDFVGEELIKYVLHRSEYRRS